MQKLNNISSVLEGFDKWRNDGEHCSLDDSCLNSFDVMMLKDFIRQSFTNLIKGIELEVSEKINKDSYGLYDSYGQYNFVIDPSDAEEALKSIINKILE